LRGRITDIILTLILVALVILAGYFVVKYFYGSYLAQYKRGRQPGLIEPAIQFLKQLGWMVLFSIGIIVLTSVFTLLQALFGQWRAAKVFIIYQNSQRQIAADLEKVLKHRWIRPHFIPYKPAEHDSIIYKSQEFIKSSDLVLVLPGSEKSFVDAEIFGASLLKKPMIFLKVSADQKTPDTSYRGYPVFNLEKLTQYQFTPLKRFILYTIGSAKDIPKNIYRTALTFYERNGRHVLMGFFVCDTISIFLGSFIAFYVNTEWEEKTKYIIYWSFTALAVGIFVRLYLGVFIGRLRATSVTRQKIRTAKLTYEMLAKSLNHTPADEEILECLEKELLSPRYEK
jgi:hypothetical protein